MFGQLAELPTGELEVNLPNEDDVDDPTAAWVLPLATAVEGLCLESVSISSSCCLRD
jgi:hypothetical protein